MDIAAWVVSVVLALVFLGAGTSKVAQPKSKLEQNPQLAWTQDFSEPMIKLIGICEILGAIGLILPWAFDIAPVLTPAAALAFVGLMIGAIVTHLRRGEAKVVPVNAVFLLLAAFVAFARFSA